MLLKYIPYHFHFNLSFLKVEVTYGEWKSVESEVAMLKEHNELLVRQAKLHQAKLQDLLRSYQSRGKQFLMLSFLNVVN